MKKYWIWFLALGLLFYSCDNNDDNVIPDNIQEEQQEQEQEEPKTVADFPVQDFIWQTMNLYYFWQQDVPNLADSIIENPADYVDFLEANPNPEDFFYEELLFGEDRFSFISENYKDLVNTLQGVSKSNGLQFQLYLFQNSDDVYGVVTYVALDSDAASKDIQRGDIFVGVDGQTLNRNNFRDLLFGDNDTYTLNMASLENDTITENGNEVTLTKVENFSENPIQVSTVLDVQGQKVGYLMYNSFLASFDDQLNEEFGKFQAEGITDLVLDLRYNGGGRVTSAVQIASSIYGTNTDELFIRSRYNNKLQSQLPDDFLNNNFTDVTFDNNTPLNALNLNRVFIIATDATASASELVINGLAPYIEVVQIGTTTVGKNEFSNTFVDDPENGNFYDPDREDNINPEVTWGLQPLLGRSENADGFSDYTNGLAPNFELEEDIANLGVLGDPGEPLLALALSRITSGTAKFGTSSFDAPQAIFSSIELQPLNQKALMDGLLKPIK